jgi:ABC-type transport system involved in multi-copper enzyme maturation permease subunit
MQLPFGRVRVLGPVLFYDLVCLARRRRYFFIRTLFPIALFAILWMIFNAAGLAGNRATYADMAARAENFFYWFMSAQFLLAILLTPAYTAGAIAEEKDRRRVDFLFATDLESQEIVFDKLVARVANLLCLLLAGLPILSFAQLWGGVDPELVLLGYGALGLTVISSAAFSMYQSVRAHKVRHALQTTYLFLFAFFGLSYFAQQLLVFNGLADFALIPGVTRVTPGALIRALGAGNILIVNDRLGEGIRAGKHLAQILPAVFFRYFLFHAVVGLGFVLAAILHLRRFALAEPLPQKARKQRWFSAEPWLKPGDQPVLWKELCVDPGLSSNRIGRILVGLIVLGSFGPAVWNLAQVFWHYSAGGVPPGVPTRTWGGRPNVYPGYFSDLLGQAINAWVRQVGIAVACLTILAAAVRAASSVSGEREQETLDSLLASPLETQQILLAKWLGSLWSIRWGALWLAIVWLVGIFMGGLNLIILPWLVLAWLVYAAFFASLGLWFSVRTNKTLTAMVWTLGGTAALSMGQFLPWLFLTPRSVYPASALSWLSLFQSYGMTPPVALGWLSFRGVDFRFFTSSVHNAWEILQMIICGLFIWLLATLLLLALANRRFRRARMVSRYRPERGLEANPLHE